MRRQRQTTAAEIDLWRRAMAEAEPLPEKPSPGGAQVTPGARIERAPASHAPLALDPQRPMGIDRRSWLRLKRGQVTIEDTVDLHGLTQAQALERLGRFLVEAQRKGLRCVVVVTGKGVLNGGVLRHMVPRWLNEAGNRERVVAYAPAQPKHGGTGALYLLIRRQRRPG
jgi:DNA-nicking Smr family endonuclease